MAIDYKILGQSAPANTNNADLYTVGTGKSAIVSTISVSNTTTAAATCRIFIRLNGAAAGTANALIYDGSVSANDFTTITIGITLSAGDIISVRSGTSNALTFQAFGSEIS